ERVAAIPPTSVAEGRPGPVVGIPHESLYPGAKVPAPSRPRVTSPSMEGLLMQNLKRMWALLGVVAISAAVAASSAVASHKAGPTIVIWTDANRAPAVTQVANTWASSAGATVKVVTKDFGSIQTNLGTVAATDAPDVILAAHDWTGALAANGLVEPLYPSSAIKAQFPSYTLGAFSYGTAVKKLYGIPVQIENIGLIVNTKLTAAPTTFAQLEATALKFKKKNHLA